ncbi:TPA_asm: polyprotein [Abies virus 1]|uniref:RNA-directed RNA polymerase n=1 Tax=Abies virus 1 TaxID=2977948 RepID=A0A9N7AB11_9RHAB|nr:TPA_asm: polyprotein [Abies virus 1]
MDTYEYLHEDEDISEIEQDDKLLCDLHLNSPLNIDEVRKILGEDMRYNMYHNNRLERSIKRGINIEKEMSERWSKENPTRVIIAGSLKAKIALSSVREDPEIWDEPEVERLLKALDVAFNKRGFKTLFGMLAEGQRKNVIRAPKGLLSTFKQVMSLALGVSEMLRGGSFPSQLEGSSISDGKFAGTLIQSLAKSYHIIYTDGTSVHILTEEEHYVTIWEDLLALLDIIGQRLSAFVSCCQAEIVNEDGYIPAEKHQAVISTFDKVLLRYGNKGYDLIGMFEAMCVGTLLQKNEDYINDPLLLISNMHSELIEMAREYNIDEEEIGDLFGAMYSELYEMNNEQLSNIFCEYRIWGHPYVDVRKGMEKIHKLGTKKKAISPYLPKYMCRIFKETILTGYHKKHGRYPAGIIDSLEGKESSYISECLRKNRPVERYQAGYTLEDWDDVELCEIFPIPSTYDLTHILNDKAISPRQQDIVRAVKEGIPLNRMEGRRGILAWLHGNTISCRDLLIEISLNGIEEDLCIIGMSEKEREIKIAARMFALMSETMRYYFVITEGLIADHILEYFPQITMKDSLNKLQKRLWTAGSAKGGHYDTNINIDFSKWNTNMRSELMTPLFHEMDKLFGLTNVISRTHEIFEKSLIYSCSGKYLPKIEGEKISEDAPMCYRGHLGGMEGLRQKGWTVGTVCLIEYVARVVVIRYNLMGQGDNQIIKLKMPEHKWIDYEWTREECAKEARSISDNFVTTLERTFSEVGLPIKPRECWRSHRLFMYGKAMLLDNKVLPQWLKKFLRSYALSNEGVLTIGGTIGTIASNCMSACASMKFPEMSYAMYIHMGVWTLRFLSRYHPFARITNLHTLDINFRLPGDRREKKSNTISFSQLCFVALMVPSIAGGSTNIPYTTYIMRGFPDPASEAYSWLKLLGDCGNPEIERISTNYYSYIVPTEILLDQLAMSPLSLNHVRVLAPIMSAKKESLEFIRREFQDTNNIVRCDKEIQELYSESRVLEKITTDPINPLLLHEIHELYPHTIMTDLISRVSSTSTIKKLSIKGSGTPIVKRIQKGEINFIGYLRWRCFQRAEIYSLCATNHVRHIRNIGWGREITGVTTPHPLECLNISCSDISDCKIEDDYIYILRDDRGGFSPYLGSSIKNKVQSVGEKTIRGEPLVKGVMRMASYANWMGLGENYKDLIRSFGELYGGRQVSLAIEKEYEAEGNFTGSMDHRFRTGTMSEGCFINYVPQVGTNIFLSTDNMLIYGRGNTNYTLHFQAMFCWTQLMAQRTSILHHGHAHIACNECVVPVSDAPMDINPAIDTIILEAGEKIRKILGVRDMREIRMHGEDRKIIDQFCDFALEEIKVKEKTLRLNVTIALSIKVSRELMSDSMEDGTEIGTEIVDLQKYPRIYGKKIYTDELMTYVALFCIIRGCMAKNLAADGESLYKVKRYVIDRLSHTSFQKMAGLGSLTIEQNIDNYKDYIFTHSGGSSYPVTTNEHMLGSISTLKRTIQRVGTMGHFLFPKSIDIPMIDFRSNDLAMYIIAVDLLKNKCMKMLEVYGEKRHMEDILNASCPKSHSITILRGLRPINISIDKMVKRIPAITCSPTDYIPLINVGNAYTYDMPLVFTLPVIARRRTMRGPISTSNKDYKEITMPTSSVYKWDEWLNAMVLTKFNVMLGDGTGTSSYTLAVNNPKCIIFPMALLEKKNITPQDLGALSPPISKWVKNVKNDAILHVRDDIDAPDFVPSLAGFLKKFDKKEVTIISDIEIGGGGISSKRVVKEIIGLGYRCYLKSYVAEFLKNDVLGETPLSLCRATYTRLGNVHYGELLLETVTGDKFLDPYDIVAEYDNFRIQYDDIAAREELKRTSTRYPYLQILSMNLTIRYLESLGWESTREMFLLDWLTLSMSLLSHINSHYEFAGEMGKHNRRITPRKRRCIERLFCILLLSTTDRNFTIEDLSKIKLLHKQKGIHPEYKYKKGLYVIEGNNGKLEKKDIMAANCIWNFRNRHGRRQRNVTGVAECLSDKSTELLGILGHCDVHEALFGTSSTFETGTTRSDRVNE